MKIDLPVHLLLKERPAVEGSFQLSSNDMTLTSPLLRRGSMWTVLESHKYFNVGPFLVPSGVYIKHLGLT